ncbi:hypothetical protein Lser_V15G01342 [Lactuca serriola]
MEATVGWCNSGCRSQYKTGQYHVFIHVSINMGLKGGPIWRILWGKIKKEKMKKKKKKRKKKVHGVLNTTQFSYDPCEYAQNFDQGLMVNDFDDLSRSFSARFAVPSTVFNKGLTV